MLRGWIEPTAGGRSAFIAQVKLHSAALDLAFSQGCYATNQGKEHAELKRLLGELDFESMLIQVDALHTQQAFLGSIQSRGPSSS